MNEKSQYPSTFYRVSLKAVIRNERGEVLLNKEGESDAWSLPGGGWDHGESERQTLARELKEEVGYDGGFEYSPIATQVFWVDQTKSWLLWIVYDVRTEHQNFNIGIDSTAVQFIDPKSLDEKSDNRTELWISQNL